MKNKIAILGFGELGKQFHGFLSASEKNDFAFFDDTLAALKQDEAVFPFKQFYDEKFIAHKFYIALGYHHQQTKLDIIDALLKLNREVPNFVHPTCFVNPTAKIGAGSFIYPMCNIDKEVVIGQGVLLNNSVCVSHNCTIGNGSYISPGVVLSGNVELGARSFIGSGTIISNNIRIGSDVIIGVGSVVTRDVPNGCSVIGNPMRILPNPLKLI